jgi:methionyl aminopeptidase
VQCWIHLAVAIVVKSSQAIMAMQAGGALLAELHSTLQAVCIAGVTAAELDAIAHAFIVDHGGTPSFLGYQGFPNTICVSKNDEIVHGIPYSDKIMYPGDICSIDIGICYDGYHVDAARTWCIGDVDPNVADLVQHTEAAFFEAMSAIRVGRKVDGIGCAIFKFAREHQLTTAKHLCSHGVGECLHEDPLIPHQRTMRSNRRLVEGMTIAIEPMLNLGCPDTVTDTDKWTIRTKDRAWSAHYENTVLVTANGPQILTL